MITETFFKLHELSRGLRSTLLILNPSEHDYFIKNDFLQNQKNNGKKNTWFRITDKFLNTYKLMTDNNSSTVTLYTEDSKKRIRVWKIQISPNKDGILYADGLLDGKMKDFMFKASKEVNIGKSNYYSVEAYCEVMLEQEVGKKLRDNYFYSIEEARNNKTFRPMLAEKYENNKIYFPAFSQPKLDGARCNAIYNGNTVILNSRTGKEFISCPHINEALLPFFEKIADREIILDGELYNHSLSNNFEEIMSLIRKTKPEAEDIKLSSELVQYHIYDIYLPSLPKLNQKERISLLKIFNRVFENVDCIQIVPSTLIHSFEEVNKFIDFYLVNGYEGQILRNFNGIYEIDLRSKNLLKHKEFFDCEFKIVDIIEGEGTNKGLAASIVIDLSSSKNIDPTHLKSLEISSTQEAGMAKGWNHEKCAELLKNKDKLIGQYATIEYFGITNHGKLRFPKMKTIRNYE